MADWKLGPIETRFAEIIWQNAPLTTAQLIAICARELGWKRTTTYTVLKKLSEKGLFRTEDSMVTALVTRQEFEAKQSQQFVEETFSGSLPAFVAAFASQKKLSDSEIDQLQALIEAMRGE